MLACCYGHHFDSVTQKSCKNVQISLKRLAFSLSPVRSPTARLSAHVATLNRGDSVPSLQTCSAAPRRSDPCGHTRRTSASSNDRKGGRPLRLHAVHKLVVNRSPRPSFVHRVWNLLFLRLDMDAGWFGGLSACLAAIGVALRHRSARKCGLLDPSRGIEVGQGATCATAGLSLRAIALSLSRFIRGGTTATATPLRSGDGAQSWSTAVLLSASSRTSRSRRP